MVPKEWSVYGAIVSVCALMTAAGSLMAEEVLTNIVKYAFEDEQEHVIEIAAHVTPEETALRFRDDGRPFDPLGHPSPEPEDSAEEPTVGGLGLVLLRALALQLGLNR